jgi:hypothetical protein
MTQHVTDLKLRSFGEWHRHVNPDAGKRLVRAWQAATDEAHKEWLALAAPSQRPATSSFASKLVHAATTIMLEASISRR